MNALRNSFPSPAGTRPARIGAALAGSLLAFALIFAPATTVAQGTVTVIVNGSTMSFDQPPEVRAGRVFVPLRGVFERLGASVVYSNGQINATGGGRTISLTIGSTQATINGQPTTIDVAPYLEGDRTLVPLRFIAQSLGATVNWNDSNSTVTIYGRGRGGNVPPPAPRGNVYMTYQFPTGTIYNHYPQIRFMTNRPIAVAGFQVMVDGRSVNRVVESNGQYFFFSAPWPLAMGTHRVRVYGQTVGGLPFDLTWTFNQASY